MTIFFDSLQESQLGYSAIFACASLGFLFLRTVDKGEVGPGYWSLSFLLSSLGFFAWSGIVALPPWQYYLAGELFHILGFFLMLCGAYRFAGNEYRKWNLLAVAGWTLVWLASIASLRSHSIAAAIMLKLLRALLFASAGALILLGKRRDTLIGKRLAGWSLIVWGLYTVVFSFLHLKALLSLAYGFLVGFQIMGAFGIVVMVVDRTRIRAEESEKRAQKLEGLLPICSYCKKIRDKDQRWQTLELYIEERSKAEFSHGICPECMEKHHPDAINYDKNPRT
jgi:signal transduction histidine kinase